MTNGQKAPVFVVGSPRSGTTLLYHMLLSSGRFAVYRAETQIFTCIALRFDLRKKSHRERLLDVWIPSDLFELSGLDARILRTRVMRECRNCGDFLRIFMESIGRDQQIERWAEKTPEHLLYAAEIKKTIPDALFIHIIRDGRDVAASMGRLGFIPPLPWHKDRRVEVAGLYWEWLLKKGREVGRSLGKAYVEIRYEDLISRPQQTLNTVGEFIGCPLDYVQIKRVGVGSVTTPNTAFPDLNAPFAGRWKSVLATSEARRLEELISPTLLEFGYELELFEAASPVSAAASRMRATYQCLFGAKQWLKQHYPFNRMVRLIPLRPGFVKAGGDPTYFARKRAAAVK